MKLSFEDIEIQRSGNFEQANFDFGDKRVIMNMLRSKIYSNPIRALCQEIMSNSRDANREVGKGDVPIEVTVPNSWEESIKFTDCGPGITRDRMNNVFIRYGNSTKRGDNIQTGGFGLGAKTPFAYSDTFTVTTVADEADGKRYKREYLAYIDESQLGAMSTISDVEVDPAEVDTGTTIQVAVHKKDIETFYSTIMDVAKFWKVKPTIHGYKKGMWKWPKEEYIAEGKDGSWQLVRWGHALVIIDGIAYTLRLKNIFPNDDEHGDVAKVLKSGIRLHFGVGELSITVSREDLDYQPDTIDKIKNAAQKAVDELRLKLDKEVENAPNLWEASCIWKEVGNNFANLVVKPKWKGLDVITKDIQIPSDPWGTTPRVNWADHIKIYVYIWDSVAQKVLSKKRYRSIVRSAAVSRSVTLVEGDWADKRPNKRRLQTLFTDPKNPAKIICVVCFDPKGSTKMEDVYSWSKLGPIKLSSIPKAKSPNTARKGGYTVHKVKKLVKRRGAYKDIWEWVPEDTRTAEDALGGIYVIVKGGKITLPNDRVISKDVLADLQDKIGQPVYGILYKYRKKINTQWTSLYNHCVKEIAKLEADPDVDKFVRYGYNESSISFFSTENNEIIADSIPKMQKSVFRDWVKASVAALAGRKKYNDSVFYRRCIGLEAQKLEPNNSAMARLKREVIKRYPLILTVNKSFYGRGAKARQRELLNEFIHYVNTKEVNK